MEEQANDLVSDKYQASDNITAIEVTSENSDIKQALLPGASRCFCSSARNPISTR